MLLQQAAPHVHQALHIGAHAGLVAPYQRTRVGQLRLDVHRAVAAQCGEAAVHFGADAAGTGTRRALQRPQVLLRELFGHVFGNGQRVPDGQVAVHQQWHLAGRSGALQGFFESGVGLEGVKAHHDFLERNAGLCKQHPGAHGPGRVILVANEQLQHGRLHLGVVKEGQGNSSSSAVTGICASRGPTLPNRALSDWGWPVISAA